MENIKIYTINGSPRKNFSTAKLLEHFAEGAKSVGAEVMPINLYDYKYTGCRECYLCKQRNGKNYAQCGFRDDITELLKSVSDADGFAVGAPIFLGDFSAQTKAFLERLLFPFTSYEGDSEFSIAPKSIRTAVFAAMNVTEEFRKENYDVQMENSVHWLEMIFIIARKPVLRPIPISLSTTGNMMPSCGTRRIRENGGRSSSQRTVRLRLRSESGWQQHCVRREWGRRDRDAVSSSRFITMAKSETLIG